MKEKRKFRQSVLRKSQNLIIDCRKSGLSSMRKMWISSNDQRKPLQILAISHGRGGGGEMWIHQMITIKNCQFCYFIAKKMFHYLVSDEIMNFFNQLSKIKMQISSIGCSLKLWISSNNHGKKSISNFSRSCQKI